VNTIFSLPYSNGNVKKILKKIIQLVKKVQVGI